MGGTDMALMLPFTQAMGRFAGALEVIGKSMSNFRTTSPDGVGRGIGSLLPKNPVGDGIGKVLSEATSGLGKLAATTSAAVSSVLKFTAGLGAASLILGIGKRIPVVGNLANTGQKVFAMTLDKVTAGFKTALLPLSLFAKKVDFAGSVAENIGKAQSAYTESLKNSTKAVYDAGEGFMSSITEAMTNPLKGLPDLASKIRPFVEAFNPFVVEQFDDAMRSVYAVIGEALVPVMKMAADVTREFAGYLRPAMKTLAPVFQEIGSALGGFLKDIMPQFALMIKEMIPWFQRFLDGMKNAAEQWPETAKAELAYRLKIGSYLDTWVGFIKDLFRKIPFIGNWFGNAKGGKPTVGAEKENIFSFGAASNPTYRAAESLGRDTLQAAYAAMPGLEDKKKERDLLEDIAANTDKANGILNQIFKVQSGAETYDARVQGGLGPNASMVDRVKGAAQWWVGQGAEKVYNFGNGVGNLWNGKSWSEGAIDI